MTRDPVERRREDFSVRRDARSDQTTGSPAIPWLSAPALLPICLIAAAMLGAGLVAVVWWTGAVPQRVFGHDLVALLDGGSKWRAGYRPHEDFYSPFGVLMFALVAVGIDLSGSLVQAIPAATCLLAVVILPVVLWATFTRLQPLIALTSTILLLAVELSPDALRFDSDGWSYAGMYNRWAYPLLGLAMLMMAARPFRATRWHDALDGAIVGACVALLVFLKISFGLLALALVVGLAPIRRRGPVYWAALLVAGLICCLIAGALLRWDYVAMLRDLGIASHARRGLGPLGLLGWLLSLWGQLLAMAGLAVAWCRTGEMTGRVSLRHRRFEACWIGTAFGGTAAAVLMTNADVGYLNESPIVGLGALLFLAGIMVDQSDPATRDNTRRRRRVLAMSLGLATLAVVPMTARQLLGIAKAAEWKRSAARLPPDQAFDHGPLKGLAIAGYGGDPPLPTSYVGKVLDGVDLLARSGNAGRTVNALDFTNPFNLVRGTRPSRTAPIAWQLGFVFSPTSAPPADRVFDVADVLMVPKQFGDGDQRNLAVLRQLYGTFIHRHYRFAGSSRQWSLYVPR